MTHKKWRQKTRLASAINSARWRQRRL